MRRAQSERRPPTNVPSNYNRPLNANYRTDPSTLRMPAGIPAYAQSLRSSVDRNIASTDQSLNPSVPSSATAQYIPHLSSRHSDSSLGGEDTFEPLSLPAPGRSRSAARRQAHIISEQSRRTAINTHLDTLRSIVPGAENADSKANTLCKTIEHIRMLHQFLQSLGYSPNLLSDGEGSLLSDALSPAFMGGPSSPRLHQGHASAPISVTSSSNSTHTRASSSLLRPSRETSPMGGTGRRLSVMDLCNT